MHALDKGALFCTGIDREEVNNARKLIYAMGYSRVELLAADLSQQEIPIPIFENRSDYDIILYLGMRRHNHESAD